MTNRRITVRMLRGEAARYQKPLTEREAAILEVATRFFGEKGYDGARTAEIAKAAGVTERTLFRYFPSKEVLYRRVMFPALLTATIPRELTDLAKLFTSESESFADWHGRILKMRIEVARREAPQFRLVLATLMSDDGIRSTALKIWKNNLWKTAVAAMRRYQQRGELRSDLPAEAIARIVLSANLGYIISRALLEPDADWDDDAEVDATVELVLRGAGRR